MKNIKNITISIFAVIGSIVIITRFNAYESEQTKCESHVWQSNVTNEGHFILYNTVTSEARIYTKGIDGQPYFKTFVTRKALNY